MATTATAVAPPDNRFLVIGPPGTGKTTYIGRQSELAVERHGEAAVMICSLTKTAAREAAGRVTLPDEQVGTLHSFVYRDLGRPEIAEGHLKAWNEACPELAQSLGGRRPVDEIDGGPEAGGAGNASNGQSEGDRLYQEVSVRRARCQPTSSWPQESTMFATLWNDWKAEHGYLDFTDLIETALIECKIAPGMPAVIFMDEAQDASRLELKLLEQWAAGAESVVTVGDVFQSLYTWRGADPEAIFPRALPAQRVRVLQQSHRVPVAVHRCAMAWISRMPGYRPIEYRPRTDAANVPVPGRVRRVDTHYRMTGELLTMIERDVAAGHKVMIQGAYGHLLNPLIKALRTEGLAFHNPWRLSNGAWNPLAGRAGSTLMRERLTAFAQPVDRNMFWCGADVRAWGEVLRADGVFLRGGKKQLAELDGELRGQALALRLHELFTPAALAAIARVDVDWWAGEVLGSKQAALAYPLAIYRRHGHQALAHEPQIIIGTIHSLKGSEADSVYLFPDVSPRGFVEWHHDPAATYRQFYVGCTRARESLTLCAPGSARFVDLPDDTP